MAHFALQLQAVAILLVVAMATCATAASIRKRSVETQFSLKDKRPFCNAFTGCGRKRSAAPISDNTVDGFRGAPPSFSADSRAELDELARHVLAQARLWEQLQHKVELLKSLASAYPDPAPETPYRRRKRAALDKSSSSSSEKTIPDTPEGLTELDMEQNTKKHFEEDKEKEDKH